MGKEQRAGSTGKRPERAVLTGCKSAGVNFVSGMKRRRQALPAYDGYALPLMDRY
jgi:hypothetical protein